MKEIESNVSLLYTEQKDKREEVDLDSDNLCPKKKKIGLVQAKKRWNLIDTMSSTTQVKIELTHPSTLLIHTHILKPFNSNNHKCNI